MSTRDSSRADVRGKKLYFSRNSYIFLKKFFNFLNDLKKYELLFLLDIKLVSSTL